MGKEFAFFRWASYLWPCEWKTSATEEAPDNWGNKKVIEEWNRGRRSLW